MGHFVPEALKSRAQWVVWRSERKPGKEKPDKVPYSPTWKKPDGGQYKASTTNAGSWGSYADAVALYEHSGHYSGIGFVLSQQDGLVFIDIDNAINIDTGEYSQTAEEALRLFAGSYAEISQSETGLHIICRGSIPRGFNNRAAGVEMYAQERYIAFTGNAIDMNEPQPMQAALNALYGRYAPAPVQIESKPAQAASSTTEAETLMRAKKGKCAEEFAALYAGQWNGRFQSQSEADLRLLALLWYYSNGHEGITLSLFMESGLAETLKRKRDPERYLERTLQRVKSSPTRGAGRAIYQSAAGKPATVKAEGKKRRIRAYWNK